MLLSKKIILASTSPRRKELFGKLGLPFVVEASDYEEDMTLKMPPQKLAKFLSYGKAAVVAKKHKSGIVIGADTFVVFNNHLLGKPKSKAEAKKMLKKLSGKRVDILTGLAIIDVDSGKKINTIDVTKVFIRKLTDQEINNYIASGEPMDKAGAFAIQGLGAVIIKRIEGDFMGAMGLPLFILAKELKKIGVSVL
ncbi:MAG: septum formation inhibitor Maf [Candidatus Magasanikbacteria bacterium GW2011_GWC2_34_16]|uniref:dTTP/UTP pyrophosphatase n=2 Tax=Candidatus Magasanikiibacteriota TaxID=1752731 RepID=A0A0G0HC52_9BACT|nr:MAG: septum formation inhibitor Maf [Candidatus Magasanikbacteria bacterium GW2011_GWC2_34_16]KKQ39747.1 MAG: septum formation inhibitor Maf [Candidatus Magasanikbacteria bacterium GW2011_GWA2_37_8]